jgi:hypothetical protein
MQKGRPTKIGINQFNQVGSGRRSRSSAAWMSGYCRPSGEINSFWMKLFYSMEYDNACEQMCMPPLDHTRALFNLFSL